MDNLPIYPWHPHYLSAILETDNTLMLDRIDQAVSALEDRLRMETDNSERQAIKKRGQDSRP